jgi:spore germination protein KC
MTMTAPGCSRMELNERGFILGAAIDEAADGKLELTTQFYKPNEGTTAATPKKASSFNIRTMGYSVFDAARDLTVHLGRKAQWSHMQAILVGEDLASKRPLGDILDFFYRDDEPRLTTPILITQGKAGPYLEEKPYIEKTISRQFKGIGQSATQYSGKSVEMNLLELQSQLNTETGAAIMPYVYILEKEPKHAVVSGGALVKNGLMIGKIAPDQVHSYLMLLGKFRSGIVPVPCGKNEEQSESFEVQTTETKLVTHIDQEALSVTVKMNVSGTVRELVCSSLMKPEDHAAFQGKVEATLERQMREFIQLLQKRKADVLGIGNELYKKHPRLWKSWKEGWDDRFSQLRFEYSIQVHIANTGLGGWKSTFEP